MEKQEFARHLLSLTSDLNYVLAAAGYKQTNYLWISRSPFLFYLHMEAFGFFCLLK